MENNLPTIAGWVGMVLILAAYYLISAKKSWATRVFINYLIFLERWVLSGILLSSRPGRQ